MSYHKYLSSDLPFNQVTEVDSTSGDRPDILIFNEPFAFVNDEEPYNSVVVIEFKRPMRKNYPESDKNPLEQVYGYIQKILDGKKTDKDGVPLNSIGKHTPFYSYIICDITPKIDLIAKSGGLTKTPDNLGYFGYNPNYNTYIEIISYRKLIIDAKDRNKILFDKLNL